MSAQKITVVGAGHVGATCAQRLAEKSFAQPHEHVAYDTGHAVGRLPESWAKVLEFLDERYPATGPKN